MASREIRRATQKKGETVSESIEKRHSMHPMWYAFTVIILVVIVVTFVLAGPGGPLTRGGGGSAPGTIEFGSYLGRPIAYAPGNYFAQQRDQIANQLQASGQGSQNSATMVQSVWYQAFMNTAEHVAIIVQTEDAGVVVSNDAIDKALLAYPGYMDDNGKFSEQRYQSVTAADRASTRKVMRENLESNVFVSDVMSGVNSGSKETEFIKNMVRPERSFSFVSYPFADFPQSEVQKFGEANKSRFTRIKVSRILVKSGESQAKEIRKKIADKTSNFEELAKTYSKDVYADKGGDMGWRYAYDLEADFEAKDTAQKVIALKNGELSDVLKGSFGWMIYRCDSEAVDADFTNPTVLTDVRAYITTYEKGKIEDYFNERATQLSRRSAEVGFDRAAREANVKAYPTDFFPVNVGSVFSFAPLKATPDSATPANAQYSEDFFYRAFTLGKDQVSAPIMLDDQAIVLKLTGEQNFPETTIALLGNWVSYVASQSLQADLAQALMTPEKFKDDFMVKFITYVMPSNSKQ
jgi:hypothetical protein